MECYQYLLTLAARPRGLHPITSEVVRAATGLREIKAGMLQVFLLHTSASLTINENADPDVPLDLETALSRLAPEQAGYRHVCEGADDMPAHIKTSLTDTSLMVPVRQGALCLGTWQGIFLWEHRCQAGPRRLVLTLWGR